jgi:hypothetical protein
LSGKALRHLAIPKIRAITRIDEGKNPAITL